MTAFTQHLSFEFNTGLRNKALLLMNYLFPLGFYAMMGVLMGAINPLFIPTMVPAMVIFALLTGAVLGLPGPLVDAREAGVFRSFRINGVPALSILVIPALTTMLHGLIAAAIITATARPLFGAPLPTNWPAFAGFALLAAFACAGLGALIGVISASSRVTILWSQIIYLPSMMLGGMMVPSEMLPKGLARVAQLLPATHAMRGFRAAAYGVTAAGDPLLAALVLLAGGGVAFALAIALFSWDSHNTTRRLPLPAALLAVVPYAFAAILLA